MHYGSKFSRILIVAALLGVCMAQSSLVIGGSLLRDGTGLYPRVVRLAHQPDSRNNGRVLAAVVVPPGDSSQPHSPIFESTDDGKTFSSRPIGKISDEQMVTGLCCITLFEVPQKVGDLEAGTLLWSGSLGQDGIGERRMDIAVYASADLGRTWVKRPSCATASNAGGLWEPEFIVAANGSLTCHFSDETESSDHSQFLAMVTSNDGGQTWSEKIKTVAPESRRLRPGMSTVRRLGSGKYVMTYEICGYTPAPCAVFVRSSSDGLDWGDPAQIGTRVFTNNGAYPAHTPVLAVAGTGATERLVLSAQMYYDRLGLEHPRMGQVLFVNPTGGEGPWFEVGAPLQLGKIYDNYCPNYSSPVLPNESGSRVLVIATNYDGSRCKPYFASAALGASYSVPHTAKGAGNGQLTYMGRWGETPASGDNSSHHHSSTRGASAQLTFYGTRAQVLASLAPSHGLASISLDGREASVIDLYSSRVEAQKMVFQTPLLALGWHSLKLTVLGTGIRRSVGVKVAVTGFSLQ